MVKVKVVKVMFWGLKNEFDQFGFDRDDRVAGLQFERGRCVIFRQS